ncbi:MAG TPA: hypothetical protein VG488_08355 [Candidatus Angelobacter sp.]|nr:hypothetical protein [Candidatus Angelobacter sp.]
MQTIHRVIGQSVIVHRVIDFNECENPAPQARLKVARHGGQAECRVPPRKRDQSRRDG